MKTIASLFTFFLLAISMSLYSQNKITVNENNESIGDGRHPALTVKIYGCKKDDIEKEWKKKMKDFDAKVSSKSEIFADNALIKSISDNTCDVYASVKKISDEECQLIVAIDLGGAYLSSDDHPSQFKAAKKIVYEFAVDVTKQAILEKQKEAEKALSKLEKEQQDLVKEKERLEKLIEDCKQKIEKAEADIETNKKDQETKTAEIEDQKKTVEEIANKAKSVE